MGLGFASDELVAEIEANEPVIPPDLFHTFQSLQTKQRKFLNSLAKLWSVDKASRAAGIHRSYHYTWLKTNPDYSACYEIAKEVYFDRAEDKIRARGVDGWLEPLNHQGKLTGDKVRRYSDNLAMFWLKRHRAEFRDNHKVEVEHSGEVTIKSDFQHDQYKQIFKSRQLQEAEIIASSTDSNDDNPQVDQSTSDLIKLGDSKS